MQSLRKTIVLWTSYYYRWRGFACLFSFCPEPWRCFLRWTWFRIVWLTDAPKFTSHQAQKQHLASLGLKTSLRLGFIPTKVQEQYSVNYITKRKSNYAKDSVHDPLKCYHPCWRLFQNVSLLLPKQTLHCLRLSPRTPRKPSNTIRQICRLHFWTLLYSNHGARSAQEHDGQMNVRLFAGGKWANGATMDGEQAGRAASSQSRKTQKEPLLMTRNRAYCPYWNGP